jgi:very-short-patch-repair endonuclease
MKRSNIQRCRSLRKDQTDAERKLWTILRNRQLNGIKFRRQFPVGGYIVDFYCPEYKLAIEADGGQHYKPKGRQRDEVRTKELNRIGVEVVRFCDRDILTNVDEIYEAIRKIIEKKKISFPSPQSSPRRVEEAKEA